MNRNSPDKLSADRDEPVVSRPVYAGEEPRDARLARRAAKADVWTRFLSSLVPLVSIATIGLITSWALSALESEVKRSEAAAAQTAKIDADLQTSVQAQKAIIVELEKKLNNVSSDTQSIFSRVYSGVTSVFVNRELAASPGNGPYVKTVSNPGVGFFSADIALPGLANGSIVYGNRQDDAFLFVCCVNSKGGRVTAGLMHNSGTDNWSPYTQLGAAQQVFAKADPRFAAGQTVHLSLARTGEGQFMFEVSGTEVGGQKATIQMPVTTLAPDGWSIDGNGQFFSRVTAVEQNNDDFKSGSYVQASWTHILLGQSIDDAQPWTNASMAGKPVTYPPVFTRSSLNANNETDTIDLRGTLADAVNSP